jgi:hypothetical protein
MIQWTEFETWDMGGRFWSEIPEERKSGHLKDLHIDVRGYLTTFSLSQTITYSNGNVVLNQLRCLVFLLLPRLGIKNIRTFKFVIEVFTLIVSAPSLKFNIWNICHYQNCGTESLRKMNYQCSYIYIFGIILNGKHSKTPLMLAEKPKHECSEN